MPNVDSRVIANWFIRRARRDHGRALSNMQLQKLVYFAHGWNLALNNEPLTRDQVQAWEFGPVIPNLYRALAYYGSGPVTLPIQAPYEPFDAAEEEVLEQVYLTYGNRTASTLSALTHRQGSPWHDVFEPGSRGLVIDNSVIARHFSELAERA